MSISNQADSPIGTSREAAGAVPAGMADLVYEMNMHIRRYYVLNDPIIPDEEYDLKYRRLLDWEKSSGCVLPHSPTQRVGAPVEGSRKIAHKKPMLSLGNVFSPEELRDFYRQAQRLLDTSEDIALCIEAKYDGCASEARFVRGAYAEALTRGDGYNSGEDITHTMKTVRALPLMHPLAPEVLDVRGEVFMMRESFERVNEERRKAGENAFANPRNAAAGSLKLLDPSEAARRDLRFAAYGVGECSRAFETHSQLIGFLEDSGFPIPIAPVVVSGIDAAIAAVQALEAKRPSLPFDIDGAVIKVNRIDLQERLGIKTREPRYAVAYKFSSEKATTKVLGVKHSVGRSGRITPVASLQAVSILGVTITSATLHNYDEVSRKDIRVGDFALVARAADVIPAILQSYPEKRTGEEIVIKAPTECPECGGEVVSKEGQTGVWCINPACPAKMFERVLHFVSRNAMNIEGMGEGTVQALFDAAMIKTPADIYRLAYDDIIRLPGFADLSARNLVSAIDKSRNTTLVRFLVSLGIPEVGESCAKNLARQFENIHAIARATHEELIAVPDLGDITACSITGWFADPANKELVEGLLAGGVVAESGKAAAGDAGGALVGKTFVITGTHPVPRSEIEAMIEKHGGKVSDSVSKKTSCLVAGDNAGSKLVKAEKVGVPIVSYVEFLAMLE